jgi:hypothetical protein
MYAGRNLYINTRWHTPVDCIASLHTLSWLVDVRKRAEDWIAMDAFLRAAAPTETETSVAHQIGKRGIKRDCERNKRRKGNSSSLLLDARRLKVKKLGSSL